MRTDIREVLVITAGVFFGIAALEATHRLRLIGAGLFLFAATVLLQVAGVLP